MVDIQSKEAIDKMSTELKVQPAMMLPRALVNSIQPTFSINPDRAVQVRSATLSDGVTATIFTTSATNDTYIIGVQITTTKDAVGSSVQSAIVAFPFGQPVSSLIQIRYAPLTAASNLFGEIQFALPVRLDRGSIVTVTNQSGVASIDTGVVVYFYEVDAQ